MMEGGRVEAEKHQPAASSTTKPPLLWFGSCWSVVSAGAITASRDAGCQNRPTTWAVEMMEGCDRMVICNESPMSSPALLLGFCRIVLPSWGRPCPERNALLCHGRSHRKQTLERSTHCCQNGFWIKAAKTQKRAKRRQWAVSYRLDGATLSVKWHVWQ